MTTATETGLKQETQDTAKQPAKAKNRRRRKFIWPELQMMVAVQTLFIAMPIVLLNFLLFYAHAVKYQNSLPPPAASAVQGLIGILFRDFLIIAVLAIPFSIGVGILYSFPFCGPIYRFNRFLKELVKGRWDRRCVLRKGDHLQEVKDSVNAAVQTMADRVYSQYNLLGKIQEVLGEKAGGDPQVKELLKAIEEERRITAPRFGESAEGRPAGASESRAE